MNLERLMMVLVDPITSEKTMRLAEDHKQFTFRVLPNAKKSEIKKAVEHLFKVSVQSVSTAQMKGKTKRFRMTEGKRSDWKKAYVTLKPGQDIDFSAT